MSTDDTGLEPGAVVFILCLAFTVGELIWMFTQWAAK